VISASTICFSLRLGLVLLVSALTSWFWFWFWLLIPGQGEGHHPNLFQVAPETSQVCFEAVSWPRVPPGLIVGWTLEQQVFNCFFSALTVWADGQVPAPDTVQVSCCQRRMATAYLCHCDALIPGPIPLPTLVTMLSAHRYSMVPGMWIGLRSLLLYNCHDLDNGILYKFNNT